MSLQNGEGKFPLFHGNGEWVIPIYASSMYQIIVSAPLSKTQCLSCNDKGVLVLNSYPNSHFPLDVLSKRKTYFEIISKSNLPSRQTRENYYGMHLVYEVQYMIFSRVLELKKLWTNARTHEQERITNTLRKILAQSSHHKGK